MDKDFAAIAATKKFLNREVVHALIIRLDFFGIFRGSTYRLAEAVTLRLTLRVNL